METSPYLLFNGDCEEAFKVYETAFGGKIEALMTHEESPMEGEVSPELRGKIMHGSLKVFGQRILASDVAPEHYVKPAGFNVCVSPKTVEECARVFGVLAEGGAVEMPLTKTFWSDSFGMVRDRFGIPWMVNCARECSEEKG